ncbi:MAG: PAS domain S-box protein [Syntrophobacteraceae bacterium]|nr:PAS domain S-box protein [Syntrophobacteraceae bacterium]
MEIGNSIRVLLIEDDEDEFIVLGDLLSKVATQSYELTWRPDRATALDALSRMSFNICLLDYRLDPENGLELLKLLAETTPNLPVILLTGAGDHQIDLEAMRAGASDYLSKDNLDFERLERSIRYSIQTAGAKEALQKSHDELEARVRERTREISTANEALRLNMERLRLAHRAAGAGAWEWDPAFNEHSWSEEIWPLLELAPHGCEPSYEAWLATIHPDDREQTGRLMLEATRNEVPFTVEWRVIRKNGEEHWLRSTGGPLHDSHGKPVKYAGIVQDVTGQKLAEQRLRESEQRLALIAGGARIGMFEWNIDTGETFWNDQHAQLLGYTGADTTDFTPHRHTDWADRVHPEDLPRVERELRRRMSERVPCETEYRVVWPDGSVHWLAARGEFLYDSQGEPHLMRGIQMDITDRKHAEEALRTSQAELHHILNRTPFLLTRCGRDLNFLYVSQAVAALFGRSPDQIAGKPLVEVLGEEGFQAIRPYVETVLQGQRVEYEAEINYRNAGPRLVHAIYVPDFDSKGDVTGWLASIADLTEHRKMSESLQVSEARLQQALEAARMVAWEYDPATLGVILSANAEKVLELPHGIDNSDQGYSLIHPDDVEGHRALVDQAIAAGGGYVSEYRHAHGEKSIWLEEHAWAVVDRSGKTTRLVGVVQNITERKLMEEGLRESEERLRLAQEAGSVGIWDWFPQTGVSVFSDEMNVIYGLAPGTVKTYEDWLSRVHPDDRPDMLAECDKALSEKQPFDLEFRILHASGQVRRVAAKGHGVYDDAGRLTRVIGINIDITGRKQAEEALRQSEQRLALATGATGIGIFDSNALTGEIAGTEQFGYLLGLRETAAATATAMSHHYRVDQWAERVHPDDWPGLRAKIEEFRSRRTPLYGEYRVTDADGAERWVNVRGVFRDDDRGEPTRFLGVIIDVTERKRMEEELRAAKAETERRAREMEAIMDAVPALIWISRDTECLSMTGNRAVYEFLGMPAGANVSKTAPVNVRPMHFKALDNGREIPLEKLTLQAAAKGRGAQGYELEFLFDDGTSKVAFGNTAPLRDAAGRIYGAVAAFVDITDRKKAEKALAETREQLKTFIEHAPVPLAMFDREMRYLGSNHAWRNRLALRDRDLTGLFHYELFPEVPDRWKAVHRRGLAGEVVRAEEDRFERADGSEEWLRWEVRPWHDGAGEVGGIIIFSENITERKKAEEALIRSEARLVQAWEAGETIRIQRDLAFGLGSANSLREVMEHLLEAFVQLDGVDLGGVYLLDSQTDALQLFVHKAFPSSFAERVSLFEPSSSLARFVRQGKPGYWTVSAGIFDTGDLLVREGIAALAVIPVNSDGKVVAAMCLASHQVPEVPQNVRIALEVIAAHLGGIISRVKLMDTIRKQREGLAEANGALKVLLRQREEDKAEVEESLLKNVKHLVLPYLEKLGKSRLGDDQKHLVEILETHLKEITSPLVHKLSAPLLGLTPMEIRVADLIRHGRSTKEIADLLGISDYAVIFHRQNLRTKLGINGKKLNLQTYLGTLL